MKASHLREMRSHLINGDLQSKLLTNAIKHLFVNIELIDLMKQLLIGCQDPGTREILLINLRKIIKQTPRSAPPEVIKYMWEDHHQHLLNIKEEQRLNDPIKWVNAEIEYELALKKIRESEDKKPFWTFTDIMRIFKWSRQTVYLRMSNSMPSYKIPNSSDTIFFQEEVIKWIKENG